MSVSVFCPNCFQSDCFNGTFCYQCGYEAEILKDQRALQPGIFLQNRYFLGKVLGMGGFGVTYLAFDNQLRQRCAIKEYFPVDWAMRTTGSNMITPNSQIKDDLYRHGLEVFVKEANILLEFQRESHIVNVWDFFEANGTAYLVMEYVEGATLSHHMREKNGVLPFYLADQMVREIGSSLYRVHKKSLLHRDISPDNIMYDRSGQMKLIDFGATREYAMNSPLSMSIVVKPGFAPIEQYSRSGRQGPHTDVYALAATYYYVVGGKKLPTAPDREAGVELIPLRQINPEVPDYVDQAIEHALQRRWQERTANMKEFVREMKLSKIPEQHTGSDFAGQKPFMRMKIDGAWYEQVLIDNRIRIGRSRETCPVYIGNPQISWEHCDVWYDPVNNQFQVTNHSGNGTYTKWGILGREQSVYLRPGEWFYLQTSEQQYIFYVEV